MLSIHEFKTLNPQQKNEEILRSLPLLFSLNDDIEFMKKTLNVAMEKLSTIEVQVKIYKVYQHSE